MICPCTVLYRRERYELIISCCVRTFTALNVCLLFLLSVFVLFTTSVIGRPRCNFTCVQLSLLHPRCIYSPCSQSALLVCVLFSPVWPCVSVCLTGPVCYSSFIPVLSPLYRCLFGLIFACSSPDCVPMISSKCKNFVLFVCFSSFICLPALFFVCIWLLKTLKW